MKAPASLLAGLLAFAALAPAGPARGLGAGAAGARLGLGVPVAAAADGDEDPARVRARKHFKKGEKLFALGRFADALAEYEQAFEEFPAPEFLFNIGQCHRNLGNLDEAVFSFRKFLKLRPDAPNRAAVEEYIDELETERARQKKPPPDKPPGAELDPVPPPGGGPRGDRGGGKKPVYKKWWFWGGVAAVGAVATTAIVLSLDDGGLPSSDLGNLEFPP